MATIEKTYKEMGLRVEKSVAYHLLLQNAYKSNLVPDISKVDYSKGHLGKKKLERIPDCQMFADDLYLFGYMERKVVVERKGKVQAVESESKRIVGKIQTIL